MKQQEQQRATSFFLFFSLDLLGFISCYSSYYHHYYYNYYYYYYYASSCLICRLRHELAQLQTAAAVTAAVVEQQGLTSDNTRRKTLCIATSSPQPLQPLTSSSRSSNSLSSRWPRHVQAGAATTTHFVLLLIAALAVDHNTHYSATYNSSRVVDASQPFISVF
jgi:hypothetical protein